MKTFTSLRTLLLGLSLLLATSTLSAQSLNIDTLAIQDFETSPQSPTWTYTGTPNDFQSGFSSASATPANSPLGIGGSRAWHVRTVSGGNPVVFDNQTIPSGYDTIRVRFRLAAMNLNGTTGGPDNLDYVLVAYSTNGGTTFSDRLRVRGAAANNCSWPYTAATTASLWYLPASEVMFQPQNSGLQLTAGIGTVELTFPGSITQLSIRITPRSSSSSDSWLIDNLVLLGENACTNTSATISASACDSYTSPSGNVFTSSNTYMDTIPNASGCDSILTINLTVNSSTQATLNPVACDTFVSPSGNIWTASNTYFDTIPNAVGCDSILTINLTVNSSSLDTLTEVACGSYTAPSGNIWRQTGMYRDTIPTSAGCDSIFVIDLTVNNVDTNVTFFLNTLTAQATNATFQWIDCDNGNQPISGETNASYTPGSTGNYAVIIMQNGCTDTSGCFNVVLAALDASGPLSQLSLSPNPSHEAWNLDFGQNLRQGSLRLYDLQGKELQRFSFENQAQVRIHGEDLKAGIYLLHIESQGQQQYLKLIKR